MEDSPSKLTNEQQVVLRGYLHIVSHLKDVLTVFMPQDSTKRIPLNYTELEYY